MSNFTLTDRQIVQLRMATELLTSVATSLDGHTIVSVDVQNGSGLRDEIKVCTFEGADYGCACDEGKIVDGEFTIELRHFHDGRSQYIDIPQGTDENRPISVEEG